MIDRHWPTANSPAFAWSRPIELETSFARPLYFRPRKRPLEWKGRGGGGGERERLPGRLVIFRSIRVTRETSRSERKKKFFGKTLFPPSPFGAITELFSEPDENLVGLRGGKFLRSLGGRGKKRKKEKELDRISRETDLGCGFGGRTNREMAKSRSLLLRYLQVGRQPDVYNCFLRTIRCVLRLERTVGRHAFLVHKH